MQDEPSAEAQALYQTLEEYAAPLDIVLEEVAFFRALGHDAVPITLKVGPKAGMAICWFHCDCDESALAIAACAQNASNN